MLVCSFIIQVTFVFLVGLPSFLLAQEQLEGRVYGVKQAIPFVRITNLTQDYKEYTDCLLYTSPSPRDQRGSRMPSSA